MGCTYCDKSKRGRPVHGHCPHWDDLTPEQCGTCRDLERITELEAEVERLKAKMGRALLDAASANGDAAKMAEEVERLRGENERLVGENHCYGIDLACTQSELVNERANLASIKAGNVEYHKLLCRAADLPETAQPGDIIEKIEALVEDLENLDHVCR